jgi:hypothetical protein
MILYTNHGFFRDFMCLLSKIICREVGGGLYRALRDLFSFCRLIWQRSKAVDFCSARTGRRGRMGRMGRMGEKMKLGSPFFRTLSSLPFVPFSLFSFSPFSLALTKCKAMLRCQIKRQKKTDPEEPYSPLCETAS